MSTRLLEDGSSRLLEAAGTDVRLLELTDVDLQPYIVTFGRLESPWQFGDLESPWTFGRLESPWTFGRLEPMSSISSISTEYRRVAVSATDSGAAVDVTSGSTVTMAFVTPGTEPDTGDWKTASWETDATRTPNRYYARCAVGPGGAATLTDGTYDVWVKISGVGSEVPVVRAGQLTVT